MKQRAMNVFSLAATVGVALLLVVVSPGAMVDSFVLQQPLSSSSMRGPNAPAAAPFSVLQAAPVTSTSTATAADLTRSVAQLKQILEREYVSFFDPMERDFYLQGVTFDDPLTSLAGVDSYQANVDLLAARTLLGKFLFRDASIVLHSVTGGEIVVDNDDDNNNNNNGNQIQDITTRWTLRMTVKAIPWQPTARFTGVSVYRVGAGGVKGVQVLKQTDYWDSINLQKGGSYAAVGKGPAIKDFLKQLQPDNMQAIAAGPELPFTLLRRGADYQVRRYPAYTAVACDYERRDEGFMELGVYCAGLEPLAPALMQVSKESGSSSSKTMAWPLAFAAPGMDSPAPITAKNAAEVPDCQLVTVPERVVAVGSFSDASVEPLVRRVDATLRAALVRDSLTAAAASSDSLQFAQYDAVYSMGARRGEVWVDLEPGGHPW